MNIGKKGIIIVLVLIALGAIGTAVYFGFSKSKGPKEADTHQTVEKTDKKEDILDQEGAKSENEPEQNNNNNNEKDNDTLEITTLTKYGQKVEYALGNLNEVFGEDLLILKINDVAVDTSSKIGIATLEVKLEQDFVMVVYDFGTSCGPNTGSLEIYDYKGKIIYESKDQSNNKILNGLSFSELEFYDVETKTFRLKYISNCDVDCNPCKINEDYLLDLPCEEREKLKNVLMSEAIYELKYLGAGNFSELTLVDSILMKDDDYFKYNFENCEG